MTSSIDYMERLKNFHPFKALVTKSCKENDGTWVAKLPNIFLTDKEIEVKNWFSEYIVKHGACPSVDTLKLDTNHGWAYDALALTLDMPLHEMYEKAFLRGKGNFAKRSLSELELEFDPHSKSPYPVDKLNKITQIISSTTMEPPIALSTMDREALYAGAASTEGLPYGFKWIDSATGGIQKGDFSVLAARLKTGKTLILCHLAVRWAKMGKRVVIASCEMPPHQLMQRIDGILGHFNPKLFRDPLGVPKLQFARPLVNMELEQMSNDGGEILFVPNSQLTVGGINAYAQENRADIVMVDGVYILRNEETQKPKQGWEQIKANSNALKQMALTMNIPVLGTTQLNKGGAGYNPTPEDIAYSDSLAQDADLVLGAFLNEERQIQLTIMANRHGEGVGGATLNSDWATMTIVEVDPPKVEMKLRGVVV